jgi:hypothetical protein
MASSMFQQLMIPIFSGKNYDNWAFRMKLAFDSYELTDIVMNGYTEPQDESILSADEKKKLDENRQKSKRALQIIGQALDDSVVGRIKPATTAKQAWDILETTYQGTSKVKIAKLQALRREFENLQMKDSDSIDQFTYRVMELVNQIRQNGDELADQKVVEKVLRSLPRKFDAIVVVIEESKDLTKYSMDELVGSLKNYEDRLNRNDNTSLEHAFKTQMTFGRGREEEIQVSEEEEEEEEIIFKEKKERVKTQEEGEIKISTQGKAITIRHLKGMTNQRFNVITTRSMVTLQMNAKRDKQI